jgi:hypothetical protein
MRCVDLHCTATRFVTAVGKACALCLVVSAAVGK